MSLLPSSMAEPAAPGDAGQAMVEYTLILALAVIVLAVPWGGHPAPIAQLVDALKSFYQDYSNYLSLA